MVPPFIESDVRSQRTELGFRFQCSGFRHNEVSGFSVQVSGLEKWFQVSVFSVQVSWIKVLSSNYWVKRFERSKSG